MLLLIFLTVVFTGLISVIELFTPNLAVPFLEEFLGRIAPISIYIKEKGIFFLKFNNKNETIIKRVVVE